LQTYGHRVGFAVAASRLDEKAQELRADAVMHVTHDPAAFGRERALAFLFAQNRVVCFKLAFFFGDAAFQSFVVHCRELIDANTVAR
jgi:hypothetical protein